MKNSLPDKLYFKIGEVAKLADVAPHVLRYWESEFDGIKPKRAKSRQRLYRKEDIVFILRIKDLLHNKGYTISGAKKRLSSPLIDKSHTPHPKSQTDIKPSIPKKVSQEKLERVKRELYSIRSLLQKEE